MAETVDAARARPPRRDAARPRDRRLAAPRRRGPRPPARRARPGHAARRDHDEPRERAGGRRGDPRRRRGLRREERGRPRRPARTWPSGPCATGGSRRRSATSWRGRRRAGARPSSASSCCAWPGRCGSSTPRSPSSWTARRLRTLARFVDGRLVDERRVPARGHALRGRPRRHACATSATGWPTATPRDEGLRRMGAQSYVGHGAARLDRRGPGHRQRHPRPARSTRSCAPRACCRSSPRARRRRSSGCGPSARSSGSASSRTACSTWWPRWSSWWTPRAGSCASTGPASRRAAGRRRSCAGGSSGRRCARAETRAEAARYYRGGGSALELPAAYEAEWQTRSGERRLISWINRPVFDAAGAVTYVLGTGTDVTDRRRLEADLRRAAFEWRETFDGLPLGVVVVDADGRIVRAQPDRGRALGAPELGGPHRHAARRPRPGRALGGPRGARGGAPRGAGRRRRAR